MSIVILALNPSIDAEWRVENIRWGEKNIVLAQRRWAGGKGVNVARWLHFLGMKPRLLTPLGGQTGREMKEFLLAEKLRPEVVPIRPPTRVNLIVTDAGGRQLRFNPIGPRLRIDDWQEVLRRTRSLLSPTDTLILSGSLPRGVSASAYAKLIRLAREAGAKAVLDCDGAALRMGVKARPFLIKPNEYEIAEWVGRGILKTRTAVLRAAWKMSTASGNWVLVSRGAKGALLVNAKERIACSAMSRRGNGSRTAINSVGAGDAMLAGTIAAMERGLAPDEWLRQSVAIGTAATRCRAGELPRPPVIASLAARIRVTQVE